MAAMYYQRPVTVTVSVGPAPTATSYDQAADTACDGDDFIFTATGNASSSFELSME